MTDPQQSAPKPRRRWTRWLLIGSLALNLLVIGALVGFAVRGPGPKLGAAPALPGALTLLRAVPDSHRGVVRDALHDHRETLRAQRRDVDALRKAFLDAIEKDPLDKAELERLLAGFGDIESGISTRGRTILLQVVLGMDHAARLELADKARDMASKGRTGRRIRN